MEDQPSPAASRMPNVAKAGAIMMISLLLSRVLGIVREMVMNWRFGQTPETDAYRLSFQIPDLMFFLVAGGALSSAFIPVFSEYLHTNRERDAWRVFSAVTTLMSLIVGGFIVVAWIFAVPLARMVAPGVPESSIPLIATMSRVILPAQFAFFIGGLMMGTLYARQVFHVPGLGPNIYNLGIIFGALVLAQVVVPGVMGMSWGALLGATIGSFVLPALMMRRLGSPFRPTLDLSHPGVKKVFRLMAPVVLGLSLPGVFPLITQYFATFYEETGLNSALANANQLMQAPLGVFGQSLALAAFPALAQFYAQGRMDLFRDQTVRTLRTVLYLSIPVSAVLIAVPESLVRALFEHGKFTPEDTRRTALCLAMYAVGVAGWCLQPVLMRAFFALHRTVAPVVLGTLATLVFILLSQWFLAARLPYAYLPLAGSASAYVLVGLLLAYLAKSAGGLDVRAVLGTMAKALAAAAAAASVLLAFRFAEPALVSAAGRTAGIVGLGVALAAFGWAYWFATRLLRMPETETIDRALARVRRRGKGGDAGGPPSADA